MDNPFVRSTSESGVVGALPPPATKVISPPSILSAESFGSPSVINGIQHFDTGPAGQWVLSSAAPAYYRHSWGKTRLMTGVVNPTLTITGTYQTSGTAVCSVYKSTDGGVTWAFLVDISGSFTAGVQSTMSGSVTCGATDQLEIRANERFTIFSVSPALYLPAPAAPVKCAIILADSIGQQFNASPGRMCWANLFANQLIGTNWRVTNMAFTGNTYATYGNNANADALAAKVSSLCDGTSLNLLIIALGVNDAINGATAFATGSCALTLGTRLRLAMPGLALCVVTPLIYASNDTQALPFSGEQMSATRTAITTAFSGFSNRITIDGLGIMTNADQVDNVHPNNTGHGKKEPAVRVPVFAQWAA